MSLHEDIRTYIVFLASVIAYPFALPPPFPRSLSPFPSLPLSLSFIIEGVHMIILYLRYFPFNLQLNQSIQVRFIQLFSLIFIITYYFIFGVANDD